MSGQVERIASLLRERNVLDEQIGAINVKWYLKREGLVDLTESPVLDYYLILAGLRSPALSSSVRVAQCDAAEIYPRVTNPALSVSSEQATLLRLFE